VIPKVIDSLLEKAFANGKRFKECKIFLKDAKKIKHYFSKISLLHGQG